MLYEVITNIPELKLVRAIHDAPTILDRFSYGKERFIAFFRATLLKHLQRDNIVFHGLGSVITSYSIHYTKLYEAVVLIPLAVVGYLSYSKAETALHNLSAHQAEGSYNFV